MSLPYKLILVVLVLLAGMAAGIKWHAGQDAIKELANANAAKSDAIQQRKLGDVLATNHANNLTKVNNQLGDARAQIAKLSGKPCLDAATVGMLNGIDLVRTPASEPADTPATPAENPNVGGGLKVPGAWATDSDVASNLATCRAGYVGLASQLNAILDIEDARHKP